MGLFSARDLSDRSGKRLGAASMGELSLITKYGEPVILAAVHFNRQVIQLGLHKCLALNLFETGTLTPNQKYKPWDERCTG